MDLNLLLALDALVEHQSVQGAARELHLTPPAMSHALRRLRAATGDDILVRNGRTMIATPRAVGLRDEVRELVRRAKLVLAPPATLDLATLERAFVIRGNEALLARLAPALLRELGRVAPRVTIGFLGEHPVDGQELVRGLADIEVGGAEPAEPSIRSARAGADRLAVVLRAGHPLAEDGAPRLADFAAAAQVTISRRGRAHGPIDEALATHGLRRTVVATLPSTAIALDVVRGTDLITVAAERLVTGVTGVEVRPLPLPLAPLSAVVSWHRRNDSDPAHAWLRGRVRELLSELFGPQ